MRTDFSCYHAKIEEVISSYLPATASSEWADCTFGASGCSAIYKYINNSHYAPLLEPTHSLVSLGGKRWRPLLLVLTAKNTARHLGLDEGTSREVIDRAFALTPLVEFVHTASLIHDDIEDSSDSRRGQPAAYITYGMDTAINAGSWLYFQAPVCISKLKADDRTKLALYEAYAMELRRLHLGQAMDIAWHRNSSTVPSQEEYISMVRSKTGTLSSLAVRIGCLSAGAADDFAREAAALASAVGAGFQIIDDVINLTTGNPGKIRGDDIVEEKKSLPVILFAQENPSKMEELQKLFHQASEEGVKSPAVEKAIALLEQSGSIQKALEKGKSFINDSCLKMEKLFNCQGASEITELFTSMIPGAAK